MDKKRVVATPAEIRTLNAMFKRYTEHCLRPDKYGLTPDELLEHNETRDLLQQMIARITFIGENVHSTH